MRFLLIVPVLYNIILRVFSLQCKSCQHKPDVQCEVIECHSPDVCTTSLSIVDNVSYVERSCEYGSHCGVSLNTGGIKQSFICCKTDLCNKHTLPESKNGVECYGCTEASCRDDFKKIECTSNQEYCASGYFKGSFDHVQKGETHFPFRGCVSTEVCGLPFPFLEINCCCGNLCNRSTSAQHHVLLLLVTGLLPSLRMPL